MTTLEAKPEYQRMDIQKRIQELLADIEDWGIKTVDDRLAETSRQRMERDRIGRIANALKSARDCE